MNGDATNRTRDGHKQRVLVVDDDKALRFHAAQVLSHFGLDVSVADSGEEALEKLDRERIDAVLLDLRMPVMDGFETCRRIRALPFGKSLPVIVATGLDDIVAVESAYAAGATDFVVKPINWTILKHRIRHTVSNRATAEELVTTAGHRHGLLNTIPDAVLSLDRHGRMLEVRLPDSRWMAGEGLFPVGALLPDSLPQAAASLAQRAIRAIQQGQNQTSFEFSSDSGNGERSYEVYLAPGGRGEMVALVRDFTERRRAEEEIRRLAYRDRVTGLPNREMMQQFVEERLAGGGPGGGSLALLRLELGGLDYARSLLGNQRADELVNQCASRLGQLVDASGCPEVCVRSLVGRVSDAGFAVALDDLSDHSRLAAFAERIHEHMAQNYSIGDYEIRITARLGVATLDKSMDAMATDLFDQAEMAMAQSDSAPEIYSSRTGAQRRDRARLMKALQSAVSNGDLHLEYQPKVDSVGRDLLGVEALARWNHPSRGPVSPAVFIPLAEESGLILQVGEFVLEEASRQSRAWRLAGLSAVPIAVNFSGHQFSKKGLVESVIATLANYSLGAGEIEIELTETVAMDQCAGIGEVLQELNDIGIRTAIDDFGTGHSSLNNLRQFQFQTLKIDRSFIADLDCNPSARSLIRGIIGMGHALGMQVVAEGVEEEYQLAYLQEQRCDLIQGYLTGRPVSGERIGEMLQSVAA